MTEREMGMILTTLDSHKEQLDRIEAHAAAADKKADEKRDELVERVAKLEVWQGRIAGLGAVGVIAAPIAATLLLG